jgi:hypothetical protein
VFNLRKPSSLYKDFELEEDRSREKKERKEMYNKIMYID